MMESSLITPSRLALVACLALAITTPIWLVRDQTDFEPVQSASKLTPLQSVDMDEPDAALVAPLFNADRTEPPALDENSSAPDAAPSAGGSPVLVGIVSGGGKAALALLKGGDGSTEIVHAGDDFSGWKVSRIDRQSIVITQAGKSQELRLEYRDAEAPPSPTMGVPTAPPGPGPR